MSDFSHLCFGCMENKGDAQICPLCGWVEGTPAEAPQHLPPGTVLHEKYVLGRVLGHGGFGITYLAWDLNLDMKLAIKEYMPRDFATRSPEHTAVSVFTGQLQSHFEHGLKKFLDEAKTLAQFNTHPGIVGVRDFFRENGTAYLVMYYLEGIDFKQYLEMQGGKIPFETALKIMMPVMDALREVHGTETLHRDISPDNIYITKEGQVKVLDFGAARHAMNEFSKSISVILKPGYAPEEQYRSKGKQGPWTDVYATAATFYRAIVGHVPPESLDRLEEDTIEPPSKLGVDIPSAAEAVLMKALAVKQTDRYQTIGEFQHELFKSAGVASRSHVEAKREIKPEKVEKKAAVNRVNEKRVQPPQPREKKGLPKWAWIAGGTALFGLVLVTVIWTMIFHGFFKNDPIQPGPGPKPDPNPVVTPKQVTVPNVLDSTEEQAKTFLTNAGLKVGNVTYVESMIVKKGHVVNQSIGPEQKAKEHDTVNLEISKGLDLPVDAAAIQTGKMDLVNEYWNKGYELDQQNDLNGALKLYIQARDIAAELVKYDGDFDAQYSQGVLSRNIASIKADLGHYYYGLQDAEESIAILGDLYAKDPVFQKKPDELASAYETLSYLQIFNGSPKEAIASAKKGLEINPNQVWLKLDLAHAYLFNGDYDSAADLYMKHKDTAMEKGKTFKDYVLDDFKRLKEAKVTHPDMERIEALFTGGGADEEEIEVTIYANAISMEEEDVAGYMGTIDPQSPVYAETEKLLNDLFNAYDQFVVEIQSIEVLEINGNTAKARVVQKMSYSDGTQTYESGSTFIHTLVRSDGVFKWLIQQSEAEGSQSETL